MRLTITEALVDVKTSKARRAKAFETIVPYLFRQKCVTDPMADSGGSEAWVKAKLQSVRDLGERIIKIRTSIMQSNLTTTLTVASKERTVAEWLVWRREIGQGSGGGASARAPFGGDEALMGDKEFLAKLALTFRTVRDKELPKGRVVLGPGENEATAKRDDIIANLSEAWVHEQVDLTAAMLGELDGKLQLMNATTFIELSD